MTERIAVGGSAANPPHIGHLVLIEHLLNCGLFDKIIWIPSGIRNKKEELIDPDHRVAMTVLTFPLEQLYRSGPIFLMNFKDVYGRNTPTISWLRRIRNENPRAEISWYTGADSVVPLEKYNGKCEIETEWVEGDSLMKDWHFYVLPRSGYSHPAQASLPPNFRVLEIAGLPDVSSTDIRRRIAAGQPFERLVTPEVAAYIKRFGLYDWKNKKGGWNGSKS